MKHPRTYHLPFSSVENDSKFADMTLLEKSVVAVSEKMDGECSTITKNDTFARSVDSNNHPSRNWLKGYAANFQYNLNEGERIVGESLYARHSIAYDGLESYFKGFMHWEENKCSEWLKTLKVFNEYGIIPVPILYIGPYDEKIIKEIYDGLDFEKQEGIVVRNVNSFHYNDFHLNVAKAVRPNHVTTDQHWTINWVKNKLK